MSVRYNIAMTSHDTPGRGVAIHEKLSLEVSEAALLTGLSPSSIRRLIAGGTLPRVPHTHRVLIPRTALEAYVNGEAAA